MISRFAAAATILSALSFSLRSGKVNGGSGVCDEVGSRKLSEDLLRETFDLCSHQEYELFLFTEGGKAHLDLIADPIEAVDPVCNVALSFSDAIGEKKNPFSGKRL